MLLPLYQDPLIITDRKCQRFHLAEQALDGLAPSFMLATPGCCACDEIGAFCEGVFCGVLARASLLSRLRLHYVMSTHGAVGKSSFLFRIGSDMLTVDFV